MEQDNAYSGSGRLAVAQRFDLTGRRALVTGGSLSIGRAIAFGLAQAGADIAIHACREADAALGHPAAAQETQLNISSLGRRGEIIYADFKEPGAAKGAVVQAKSALSGLDILVICASIQSEELFASLTPEFVSKQLAVNFHASIELLQATLPDMLARRWGRVLSIGSINQVRPNSHLSIYAALKAAQHNLIIGLARQHAAHGVTLNTLSPGLVETARNQRHRIDEENWSRVQKRVNPMGRAAMPDEMVGAALLLCSDAGSFITGVDLQVTGGGHL